MRPQEMSDLHFVLRHAITGIVLLGFIIVGIWIITPDEVLKAIKIISEMPPQSAAAISTAVITGIITVPIIGIAVQGIHIFAIVLKNKILFGKHAAGAFSDPARNLVAVHVRSKFRKISSEYQYMKEHDLKHNAIPSFDNLVINHLFSANNFENISDDAIFVWMYHMDAPAHMIDWARRRRSYYYLGINIAISSILGLIIGALIPQANKVSLMGYYTLCLFIFAFWIFGAWFLSMHMKRDADTMELVWAFGRLFPEFKRSAFCATDEGSSKK
jgi:hypothetical protein